MTEYSAYQFTAQDEAGNVVAGAKVEIRSEADNSLPTLYGARDGSGAAPGNPATTDSNGFVRVYLNAGRYKVRIYTGSSGAPTSEQILRDVEIGAVSSVAEPTVVTGASATIAAGTEAVVVQRAAPSTTALALPAVAAQDGQPLRIADFSTSVTAHEITLTPDGSETIMGLSSWVLYSNASSLAGVTLIPSTTLGGWYIAP